jgi:hypothetical protein
MTARTDNRLADAPMVPVTCRRCGAKVLARKSSWQQTSVQWDAAAMARCPQRRAADLLTTHGRRDVFLACSDLAESIRTAAHDGELPVVDDQPLAADRPARRP